MEGADMRKAGVIITIISALLFGAGMYMLGVKAGIERNTCHSTTEDSELYDCDFHDHSWTRK